jgi:hypothetical protein
MSRPPPRPPATGSSGTGVKSSRLFAQTPQDQICPYLQLKIGDLCGKADMIESAYCRKSCVPTSALHSMSACPSSISINSHVTGGGAHDFPGFEGCGSRLFSKGCVDGGMSLDEQLAISEGSRMVNGQKATFRNWANWMRAND